MPILLRIKYTEFISSLFGIRLEDGRDFKSRLHFLTSLPEWPVAALPLLSCLPRGRLHRAVAQARTIPCGAWWHSPQSPLLNSGLCAALEWPRRDRVVSQQCYRNSGRSKQSTFHGFGVMIWLFATLLLAATSLQFFLYVSSWTCWILAG